MSEERPINPDTLRVGAVVRLKSQIMPRMTVTDFGIERVGDPQSFIIVVSWLDYAGQLQTATFRDPNVLLEVVS